MRPATSRIVQSLINAVPPGFDDGLTMQRPSSPIPGGNRMSAVLKPGIPQSRWPAADFTQMPFSVHVDAQLFELEQERIFRSPCWNYLGLEAEIPNHGDFVATYVGVTRVVRNHSKVGK